MANMSWFFERMEEERELFAGMEIYVPSRLSAFQPWKTLLMEDEESLSQRSAAARSVRRRVKSLLVDTCSSLGVEVFVLVTFSAPMSKLHKVDAKTVLPGLRTWWRDKTHPDSLACFSRDLVKKFNLAQVNPVFITTKSSLHLSDSMPTAGRKRRLSQVSTIGQDSYETSSASGHEATRSSTEDTSLPLHNKCITDGLDRPMTTIDDRVPLETEPVAHMKLGDLMDFFHQRKMGELDLHMRCTYSGIPLPFVEIGEAQTLGLSGKLEFSLRLSEAFLQFMQARSTFLE